METAKAQEDIGGLTHSALELLKGFGQLIADHKEKQKKTLEDVRTYRMALTSDLALIESAIKKVQNLGTQKLVADLESISKALSNPYIQKLLKGDTNGNQG